PSCSAGRGGADGLDGGAGQNLGAAGAEFGVHESTELGGGRAHDLGLLFPLGDAQAADGQGVGHFQADVPGADDDRAGRCGFLEDAHDGEGVAHGVQQVHPVDGAEGGGAGQAGDGRAERGGGGTDDELVVAEHLLAAVGGGDQELAAGYVDPSGGGV